MDKKSYENGIKNIANQVAYYRNKEGLTQQELADKVGTTKSGISRIESGRQNVSYEQIYKIAESLNLSARFVIEEINEYNATCSLKSAEYELRLYDDTLISFSLSEDITTSVEIKEVNNNLSKLFPVGLELSSKGLLNWLSKRTIPKNRAFVGALLQSVGLKNNSLKGIVDISKGLSLNDSYWVVPKGFNGKFNNYNLYENDFSAILSLVAYTGYPYSEKKFSTSPEFTTGGMLRKGWRFKDDGIWLYKGGSEGFANAGNEPYSEYYAYQIAKAMGLDAVEYSLENWKGILASKCRLFCNIDTSFVPAGDVIKSGDIKECLDYYKTLGNSFYQNLVSMIVLDAVIINEDRHFGNFGLLRDNRTGKYISAAPIFDNGKSLLSSAMKSDFDTKESLETYILGRATFGMIDYFSLCKELMGSKQKKQLRNLMGFKFEDSDVCNLPRWRTEKLEEIIQDRVKRLLL